MIVISKKKQHSIRSAAAGKRLQKSKFNITINTPRYPTLNYLFPFFIHSDIQQQDYYSFSLLLLLSPTRQENFLVSDPHLQIFQNEVHHLRRCSRPLQWLGCFRSCCRCRGRCPARSPPTGSLLPQQPDDRYLEPKLWVRQWQLGLNQQSMSLYIYIYHTSTMLTNLPIVHLPRRSIWHRHPPQLFVARRP